ncbi:MAG: hypothetical protein OXI30_17510 [Chloroflexota bacterium]|nr:hypothetical protein [Chloroflexota bacterium]
MPLNDLFATLPMSFDIRPAAHPNWNPYVDNLRWQLEATFGRANFGITFDQPHVFVEIPAQEEGVSPYAFGQLILLLDYHRDPRIGLGMQYPDCEYRRVKHFQVMRRYLFHHWDRPKLAGKTPRKFWGLHIGKNALPSYPWDDPFIAYEAAQRSMKLSAAARGATSMQELLS